jgi:hypothetical protein
MNGRCLATVCAVMVGVAGQTLAGGNSWEPVRTPWGDPDLQGIWTNTTTTPLQRPDDLGDQVLLTDEERAARDETGDRAREARGVDREVAAQTGETGSYNNFWVERGFRLTRTALIVDPPNGKLPPLTPKEAMRRAGSEDYRNLDPNGPEDRNLYERCISRGMPGAMMPGFYNHNYQILQTPGYVVILVEMIHDARIIPLDGRPHANQEIRQWLGDSRGRWEGNTLVVETTNFTKVSGRALTVFGGSETTRLVERFTRVDEGTIDYQFTLTDPTEYAQPWTAAIPMTNLEGVLFEYACHEGNYGLENILTGARAADTEANSK